ncbi:DUF6573 family protein [Armatimonas sp.]|uniref:DUF6573 family protein n=1 Tax=Armatimonas sp. TaxID=1872638 RepID=UPI00374D6126
MYDNLIYSYTRAQAIEDGVLVEVGPIAQEAGYRVSVALTAELWGKLNAIPEDSADSLEGRLWDLLFMGMLAMKRQKSPAQELFYEFLLQLGKLPEQPRLVKVKMVAGPGDNGELVITITLPHED